MDRNPFQDVTPEKIRNVALVGHGGCRQDDPGRGAAALRGAIPRMGRVEDGTPCDTEPEEAEAAALGCRSPLAPVPLEGPQDQPARLPRLRRLLRRGRRRAARRRPGRVRGERGRRRGGADRGRVAARRPARASPGWSSSTSSTGSGPDFDRTLTQLQDSSAPASPRSSCPSARRPGFRGVARPAHRHGPSPTTRGTAARCRPRRPGGHGAPGARRAGRGHRRRRRRR